MCARAGSRAPIRPTRSRRCAGAPSNGRSAASAAEFLDKAATERHLGTAQYDAGWLDRRGGAIQPLAYARGLARAALDAGAAIHGQSRVTALARNGARFTVTTERGRGGDGGEGRRLHQRLHRRPRAEAAPDRDRAELVPDRDRSRSPTTSRKSILPEGQVSSDTRKLLLYFRLDHAGRFIMGGRGPFREPQSAADWAHLERVVGKMFPQLKGEPIEHRWCGRVALTRDFLPHLHEPEPGLLVDIGCMGRGVGLQTAMGQSDGRVRRDRRQARAAVPARPDPAAALPPAAQGLRLGDHRLVPDDGWRREAAA